MTDNNGVCVNGSDSADSYKLQANQYFKDEHYDKAIELYTKAISLNDSDAVYFGNRSFALLKTELYGSALQDANRAIELDNNYIKGYYRRAAANVALGKFKLALRDYELVHKARPTNSDAKRKYVECNKIVQKMLFEKAISVDSRKSVAESIDLLAILVEDTYSGPRLDNENKVSVAFMRELLDLFQAGGKLHRRYAYQVLLDIRLYFMSQPSLVDIDVPAKKKFTICGDVHGQFYDLLNIFKLNGLPSEENPYLFNGDFVDRGSFSVETIFTLFGFKLLYPRSFFMSRGNHESQVMNQMYGFEGEVKAKYSAQMADLFTEIYNHLPLCHLINKQILVMHGGLFKEDGVKVDELRSIDRNRQPPEEGLMCDLLWSDPQPAPGRAPSKRGVGVQFGPDVTKKFCAENNLRYIIRSHEVKPEGYEVCHDGKCITVFSAPNYCDTMGNQGAFVVISGSDLTPKFTTFDAVDHPKVAPMAYASALNLFGLG